MRNEHSATRAVFKLQEKTFGGVNGIRTFYDGFELISGSGPPNIGLKTRQ
jgi:hypothetical protein